MIKNLSLMWNTKLTLNRVECKTSMESYAEALESLDDILENYDARNLPRPSGGNGNVTVTTNAFIRGIPKLDEIKQVT